MNRSLASWWKHSASLLGLERVLCNSNYNSFAACPLTVLCKGQGRLPCRRFDCGWTAPRPARPMGGAFPEPLKDKETTEGKTNKERSNSGKKHGKAERKKNGTFKQNSSITSRCAQPSTVPMLFAASCLFVTFVPGARLAPRLRSFSHCAQA